MSDCIQFWLNQAGSVRMLEKEELVTLCNMRDKAEESSRQYATVINRICEHNLRLVANQVKGFVAKRSKVSMASEVAADLLQVGYFGLRRAAEKYDPSRGFTFSTYAIPWIRQAIQRWSMSNEHATYIPESTMREVLYRRKHGKPSGQKGVTNNEGILMAANQVMATCSLDVRLNDDDDSSLVDIVGEENRMLSRTTEFVDNTKKLRDLMAECGIEPKIQDLMNVYAQRGNLMIAATKSGVKVKEARGIVNQTVDTLKARLEEKETAKRALIKKRIGA